MIDVFNIYHFVFFIMLFAHVLHGKDYKVADLVRFFIISKEPEQVSVFRGYGHVVQVRADHAPLGDDPFRLVGGGFSACGGDPEQGDQREGDDGGNGDDLGGLHGGYLPFLFL